MASKREHIRTVVNSAPLTIDYIINAYGEPAYQFTSRERKLGDINALQKIRMAVTKELERQRVIKDKSERNREYYQKNKQLISKKRLEYYRTHRQQINEGRRKR